MEAPSPAPTPGRSMDILAALATSLNAAATPATPEAATPSKTERFQPQPFKPHPFNAWGQVVRNDLTPKDSAAVTSGTPSPVQRGEVPVPTPSPDQAATKADEDTIDNGSAGPHPLPSELWWQGPWDNTAAAFPQPQHGQGATAPRVIYPGGPGLPSPIPPALPRPTDMDVHMTSPFLRAQQAHHAHHAAHDYSIMPMFQALPFNMAGMGGNGTRSVETSPVLDAHTHAHGRIQGRAYGQVATYQALTNPYPLVHVSPIHWQTTVSPNSLLLPPINDKAGDRSYSNYHGNHFGRVGQKKNVIACGTCRARKLKCDQTRPRCGNCAKRPGDTCEYDTVVRRRGPGKKRKAREEALEVYRHGA